MSGDYMTEQIYPYRPNYEEYISARNISQKELAEKKRHFPQVVRKIGTAIRPAV